MFLSYMKTDDVSLRYYPVQPSLVKLVVQSSSARDERQRLRDIVLPLTGGDMLNGLPILIVEDEQLVALDLALAIEHLDGCPVGPVGTVAEAFALLESAPVAAAILDANLLDRDVTPLAIALVEKSVPFVIHSGTGLPAELAAQHPSLPVIRKPARSTAVLAALLQRLSPDRALF
jgi:hypothetical protein